MDRLQLMAVIISVFVLLFTVEAMRRNRIKEEYSIIWLLLSLGIAGLAVSERVMVVLAELLGTIYPASALYLAAFMGGLILFMHLTIVVSQMNGKIVTFTQELALLRLETQNSTSVEAGD